MLDAYVIERIRREREREERDSLIPLHVPRPTAPPATLIEESEPTDESRGSVEINFEL